jgi:hypothetical protein
MSCNRLASLASWLLVAGLAATLFASSAFAAGWKEKVLYSFQGYPDGYTPAGGVIFGKGGNLYGAIQGGGSGAAPGAVFQLSKQGNTWNSSAGGLYGCDRTTTWVQVPVN